MSPREDLALATALRPQTTIATLGGAVRRVEQASLAASLGCLALLALATVAWLVGALGAPTYLTMLALALPVLWLTAPLHARALEARLVVDAATRRAARQCRRLGHAAVAVALVLAPLLAWLLLAAGDDGALPSTGPGGPAVSTAAVLGLVALIISSAQVPVLVRARRDWPAAMLAPTDALPGRTATALRAATRRATVTAAAAFLVILAAGTAATLTGLVPSRAAPEALAIPAALGVLAVVGIQMTSLHMGAGRLDHAASWRSRTRCLAFVHLPLLLAAGALALQGLGAAVAGWAGHGPLANLATPVLLALLGVSAAVAAAVANVGLLLTGLLAKTLVAPGRRARRIVDAVVSAILG